MKGEYISIETSKIIADMEEENKKLYTIIDCLEKDIKNLHIVRKQRDKYFTEKKDYENRINKAIEYIKDNTYKIDWGDLEEDNEDINISEDLTDKEFIENLLEILKGI